VVSNACSSSISQHLVSVLVGALQADGLERILGLQKFEIKLQQFNEMEEIIEAERRELEQARQQLFLDWRACSNSRRSASIISSISLNCCSLISNFCRVTLTAAESARGRAAGFRQA
jgi:hypothetical protein